MRNSRTFFLFINPLVNYLFDATITDPLGEKLEYNIYEFKLAPGRYKAALKTPLKPESLKELVFWKEHEKWVTNLQSSDAKRLVKLFGWDIDHLED